MNPERQKALAEGRQKAREARSGLPRCTNLRPGGKGVPASVCGQKTTQNERELERHVFWCPRCQKYPWGSGGGRSGGGPDKVPASAWPA